MSDDASRERTLSVLVDNEPGTLVRVAGLFSGRGYNIISLTVAEVSSAEGHSRMTIATHADALAMEQIKAQLRRLVPVVSVVDLSRRPSVERDLALVKIATTGTSRVEALSLADAFRARVVDASPESFVFEITGKASKIDAFVEMMRGLGYVEMARAGVVGLARGPEASAGRAIAVRPSTRSADPGAPPAAD